MLCFYDHWLIEIIFGGEYLDFWHLFIFALMFVADTELLLVEQQHRLHTDGQCFWQRLLELWLILTNRQLPYLDKLRSACYHPESLIPHIKNIQPLNAWWFSLDFCLRFVAYYIIDFDAAEVLTLIWSIMLAYEIKQRKPSKASKWMQLSDVGRCKKLQ